MDERAMDREVLFRLEAQRRKSGGRARKAAGLTSGDLRRVSDPRLERPQGRSIAAQESAEGIVVAGSVVAAKARTVPARG